MLVEIMDGNLPRLIRGEFWRIFQGVGWESGIKKKKSGTRRGRFCISPPRFLKIHPKNVKIKIKGYEMIT